jgi:Xaa-Pro dipeptidase
MAGIGSGISHRGILFMQEEYFSTRLLHLSSILRDNHLDALVLNPGPDLIHLTGLDFHLMERPVVGIFREDLPPVLVLPILEKEKLAHIPYPYQAFPYPEERAAWKAVFRDAVLEANLRKKRIGVISRRLRVLELHLLQDAAQDAEFIPAEQIVSALRVRKDAKELAIMREAVLCAETALQETMKSFLPGRTEKELAAELTIQLLKNGSDPLLPFSPIVSAGPNSANPHASPMDREIAQGELLLIDWGANIGGYYSDITRTFAVGHVSPILERIADLVSRANLAARETVGMGISAREIDHAARAVIASEGYADFFIHRTGHGLGREAHEEPYIAGDNDQVMETGMTFTIEPGIYLPGQGGVRIEDDVVVTSEGCESLTTLPRQLIRI